LKLVYKALKMVGEKKTSLDSVDIFNINTKDRLFERLQTAELKKYLV